MQQGKNRFVSVQLYAVRDLMNQDFPGVMKKLAALGYGYVELYHHAYGGASPAEIKGILAGAGLKVSGCHVGMEDLENKLDETLAFLAGYDCPHIICGWAEYPTALAPWQRARFFNQVGKKARESGLFFSLHNHRQEFSFAGGRRILDILMENTDPALVGLEMDTYWAVKGGADPAEFQARWKHRSPLIHLKDYNPAKNPDWATVGDGIIDFAPVIKAASETRGFVFDLDDSDDLFRDFGKALGRIRELLGIEDPLLCP
ncbi:MAG: sugar phosphate isomerase/epimerase [Treponema sp.]|jgi:sugar phosphate isomerase/epimerase|nr:sugar phosphate isomerase/epimerase [Treponema sp.]